MSGAWRWGLFAGLYLALAGNMAIAELTAAILAGATAMALSLVLGGTAERTFSVSAPWHRLLFKISWALARDVQRVGRALVVAIAVGGSGTVLRQPFVEPRDYAAGAGRRALAVLLASLAPNGYVIAEDRGAFLVHRLAKAPPSPDREWPA